MLATILNTGCANISSVKNIITNLGYKPIVSCDCRSILNTDKLIIPDIGTASLVMDNVRFHRVSNMNMLREPTLGICLGMQLMCLSSKEGSSIKAIGIIDNQTEQLPAYGKHIPHIGWNRIINLKNPYSKALRVVVTSAIKL